MEKVKSVAIFFTILLGSFSVTGLDTDSLIQANLIVNSDFENIQNGKPEHWEAENASLEIDGNEEKGKYIILKSLNKNKNMLFIQRDINVEPDCQYKFSFRVLALPCDRPYTDTGYQPFRVLGYWHYKAWKTRKLASSYASSWDDVMGNWQKKTVILPKSPPINTIFTLSLEIKAPGAVCLGNFMLEKMEPVKEDFTVALEKPYYRSSLYSDSVQEKVELKIKRKNSAIENFKIALLPAKETKPIFETSLKADDDLRFIIPVPNLPCGSYDLFVSALAQDKVVATQKITINKFPPHNPKVTIRDDNTLMINDKPFFPVGLLDGFPILTDENMTNLSKYGINCIGGHVRIDPLLNTERLMKMAQRNNMKILLEMFPQRGSFDEIRKCFDTTVKPFLRDQALLGYLVADEPAWAGEPLDKFLNLYDYFKQADPYHPVWINYAPRNSVSCLAEYNKFCDITGCDIYPVPDGSHSGLPDKSLTCVGKYTERMRETVANRKPVWMVLQGTSWCEIPGRRPPMRYPSLTEIKFMIYDAVVHGAKGIFLWGTDTIRELKYWGILFSITSELKSLSPALIVRDTKGEVSVLDTSGTINFIHKKTVAGDYIIAINDSSKPADVKFQTKFKNEKLFVCFEDRDVTLSEGIFSDNFVPYAVHLYTTDPNASRKSFPVEAPEWIKNIAYWGNANWIWYPEKTDLKGPVIRYFRQEFTLDEQFSGKAVLGITADANCFEIYVNGEKLASLGSGWKIMEQYEIGKLLTKGKNLLAVKARRDAIENAALLFDINIYRKDSVIEHVISDKECISSKSPGNGWYLPEISLGEDWSKTKIIGKYGIKPWSNIYPYPVKKSDDQPIYFNFGGERPISPRE
ncbi:MAG: hypothetical protein A2020_00670 [Lentisphaerae bacterium GWF2_45_14]|nr:MAG: hypothetical protein A2020_00670 [Lentisphaerae bacterium GWF2_45_14]